MEKTFSILTLGCKVNQYESESMAELFEKSGYREVDGEKEIADVYVINTCTVTNLSDRKSRQFIRRAKKENPSSTVAVVGCYAQVSSKDIEKIKGVDVIIGTTERSKIVELCEESQKDHKLINIVRDLKKDREFQNIKIEENHDKTRTYIKVQDGCNRFCSYCIIPYARGEIRSRPIGDSVNEAKRLALAGYKEIILTGIHIGSYGYDLGPVGLIDLIEEIAKVPGIERIRLSSVEPNIITDEFMERALATKKLCDHFHLSLQSGSNNTLKSMNRHYSRETYIEKTRTIKKYMPYAGLTTDIIVGFPGESEKDFEDSISIVREVGFSKIHVFKYSMRKNTPAAELKNQIDGNIKIQRSEKLIALGEKYLQKFRDLNKNRSLEVLFEEYNDGYFEGYTRNYIKVKVKSNKDLKNQIKNVKILNSEDVALAEII